MICLWGALHFVAFLFAFFIIHTFFLYNFYYFAFCICITAWFFFFKLSLLSELATAAVQQRMTAVKSQSWAWSEQIGALFWGRLSYASVDVSVASSMSVP